MKISEKFAIGLLFAVFLFSGCSKHQPKQKTVKAVDSTTTRATRKDSFPKEPKNFKSIHQLELEQHEKKSAQTSGGKK